MTGVTRGKHAPDIARPDDGRSIGGIGREERRVGLVRGVIAERVVVSTTLDPFLDLRALAAYSCISIRKLRDYLDDTTHPLPCYRVGGKILVRRSEFDAWIGAYRARGRPDVDAIVADVLRDLH
ncbi:MAG: helix-turn-helix domain-containing protein [Candidatus Rokubacteria bacterium]|nr:helix-turn-helix domain-containing protein [Candidatus Rokubacteria bacterium]